MDEVLASVAETIKNFAVIYLVDISEVPDFNTMYELYDPSTIMFFFRNKHIMIDLGTGNNNKINWALKNKQEFIDIVETVYRGARKGRGLVISPKDYSTKYRYWGSENNASSSKTVSFNLVTIMMESSWSYPFEMGTDTQASLVFFCAVEFPCFNSLFVKSSRWTFLLDPYVSPNCLISAGVLVPLYIAVHTVEYLLGSTPGLLQRTIKQKC